MIKALSGIAFIGLTAISVSGCQAMKSSVNFVTDNMYAAQLPESTSTRLQVVTGSGGSFNVTPNSSKYRSSTKLGAGVLSMYGSSESSKLPMQGFTDKEKRLIYDNNLNMTKPTDREKQRYNLEGGSTAGFSITERYITPNQPISFKFRGNDSFGNCTTHGTFTPDANSNYRLTGVFGRKCVIMLEKLSKDSRGNTTFQSIGFDD